MTKWLLVRWYQKYILCERNMMASFRIFWMFSKLYGKMLSTRPLWGLEQDLCCSCYSLHTDCSGNIWVELNLRWLRVQSLVEMTGRKLWVWGSEEHQDWRRRCSIYQHTGDSECTGDGWEKRRRPNTNSQNTEAHKKEVGGECEMAAKSRENLERGQTV